MENIAAIDETCRAYGPADANLLRRIEYETKRFPERLHGMRSGHYAWGLEEGLGSGLL
jgi:hypothetical protein